MRRALSHIGGAVRREGDADAAARLAEAVDVPPSSEAEELARAHVHGFHSYPARMHPLTARRLVEAFSPPGARVLDPFCGSGTVVVEARLSGREAMGVDMNPLAVRLCELKARGRTAEERARMLDAAREAARFADERRKAKSGATRRYGPEDTALFAPYILLELDSLRAGIDRVEDARARRDLELVLSSILVKLSKRTSDTSEHAASRRIAAGFPARLFVRKAEELAARLDEVAEVLAKAPPLRVLEGDARRLDGIDTASVHLIVTSPPYPGNYDYLEHHAARLRWLRLGAERFDHAEIGARRRLDRLSPAAARARWREEIGAAMEAMARVLTPGGSAVLLIADSVVAGAPVYAVDMARELGQQTGLLLRAVASQERPHFHAPTSRAFAARPRGEHAILLERDRRQLWHDAERRPRGPAREVGGFGHEGSDRRAGVDRRPSRDGRGVQQGRGQGRRGGGR